MAQAFLSKYWHPALMAFQQCMDYATTIFLLRTGVGYEGNPLMAPIVHGEYGYLYLIPLKLAGIVACFFIWKHSKKLAWIITILYTVVVLWNLSLISYAIATNAL